MKVSNNNELIYETPFVEWAKLDEVKNLINNDWAGVEEIIFYNKAYYVIFKKKDKEVYVWPGPQVLNWMCGDKRLYGAIKDFLLKSNGEIDITQWPALGALMLGNY